MSIWGKSLIIVWSILLVLTSFVACNDDEEDDLQVVYTEDREPCDCRDKNRNLYFGDLHAHTRLSFDAQAYELRVTPDQAYGFAKGEAVALPPLNADGNGTRTVELSRPLDFVALTDHSEFFAEYLLCTDDESSVYDASMCQAYREGGEKNTSLFGMKTSNLSPIRFEDICPEGIDICAEAVKKAWHDYVQAAEDAYDKTSACSFTTFVGYEYTGSPKVSNNHRNIIFRTAQVPEIPISYFERQTEEGLWDELKRVCLDQDNGCDCIAIPHNSNWSNGNQFMSDYPEDMSLDQQREAAAFRVMMEPLIEIHQHKGDMECKNGFEGNPYDPLCGFEKVRGEDFEDCGGEPGSNGVAYLGCVSQYDYLRNILKLGLSEKERLGVNPYKMGVIGSTDTHNGTPGNTEEYSFPGHSGVVDATPEDRLGSGTYTHKPLPSNPGGLVAVWSHENSRDALFEAFRQRETYSTSGTRLTVRFFGGWGYPDDLCENDDFVSIGYEYGVAMGGDLPRMIDVASVPTFAVMAQKDPGVEDHPGNDLQQIQIIKGWIDVEGNEREKVFLVAGDPNNGASVDLKTCEPTGTGWEELCAVWTDPEFDPGLQAFYYARVVENPSCSWRQYDCNTFSEGEELPGVCSDPDLKNVIQERAITSPIWYEPKQ